ncbi:MAG: hypothetical protein AB1696_23990 [Planctomycetota bacterium]
MRSIFDFWNRAFPNLTWSRDYRIAPGGPKSVWSQAALTFTHEFPAPRLLLPLATSLLIDRIAQEETGGAVLAHVTVHGKTLPAISRTRDGIVFHFDLEECVNDMTKREYWRAHRPLGSRTPFHYHAIPGGIRRMIGRTAAMLGPKLGKGFPPWPVADAVEILRRCVLFLLADRTPDLDAARFWPGGKRWAAALSHDVDTQHGAARVPDFFDLEQRLGLRSTWFFPACHYVLDGNLLQRLIGAGHEVACHGYNHDCKLPYLERQSIADRLNECIRILAPFGVRGFRSPALGRTRDLFEELSGRFTYDSSVPDTEAGSGCCTVFPYSIGDLLELPITVPMDATLLLHGYKPDRVLDVWIKKIGWIKKTHGLAVIVTHPEPHFSGNPAMIGVYAELLAHLSKAADCWIAPIAEIAEWWRRSAP